MNESFLGEAYKYIYLAFCFLLMFNKTLAGSGQLYIEPENPKSSLKKTVFLGGLFILFFGFRPTSGVAMADTSGYAVVYELFHNGLRLDNISSEVIWYFIIRYFATHGVSVSIWFTVIAAIYILFNIGGIKRLFPEHTYSVFLLYAVFFLFYSGGINGIRNACGYSIVFYAMSLYTKPCVKNYILMVLWCYVGYQFHTSVIITAFAFLISLFIVKSTKPAILIWLLAIVIALAFGNSLAFYGASLIEDNRAERYLQYAVQGKHMDGFTYTGFRWDFLIFSALPIAVGYYVTVIRGIKDRLYQLLLNTYIIANAVWIIFIYAAFSNRFAMLSWCIYPYVLIYPYLKYNLWPLSIQNSRALMMLWSMFIFTIYMMLK